MGSYNSAREIAQKMSSEGGLAEFLFGYGFSEEDITEDISPVIQSKLLKLMDMAEIYEEIASYFYNRAEDEPVPGDWDYEDEEG